MKSVNGWHLIIETLLMFAMRMDQQKIQKSELAEEEAIFRMKVNIALPV
ncbi:hypothetical protein [Thalassobacillus devorans]|nr:hypothetical protein [Thalassobacillus devorans]